MRTTRVIFCMGSGKNTRHSEQLLSIIPDLEIPDLRHRMQLVGIQVGKMDIFLHSRYGRQTQFFLYLRLNF